MAMPMAQRHPLCFTSTILTILLLFLTRPAPSLQQQQQHISSVDLAALLAVKNSLTDIPRGSAFFSTWDFAAPDPCSTFSGVTCTSSGRVTILTLGTGLSGSPGLAGSLSPSLADLTELTQLVLFPGIVTGPIPPQLGRLPNLRVLSLTNNRLTGPVPPSFSFLRNLHTLDLSNNQLTGLVPSGVFGLPGLKVLVFASNRLTGRIPPVSAQLLHLDLKNNRFFGPIPPTLPRSLRYLSFSENGMWGPINGLTSLSELVYLDLSMNRFSGPIPASLFNPTLSSMLLQRNNLSGGVPPGVGGGPPSSSSSYGEGSMVDLSHNALTGEISTVLVGVESLFLNNNRLTGEVPEEYVDSVVQGRTRTLYLQHNFITGFPLASGADVPDTASLCLSYNCMVPPVGFEGCPASAGSQLSRPTSQCSVFRSGSSHG